MRKKGGNIYILASRPHGTLYIGVTSDLEARIFQHRQGVYQGFTKQYAVHRLVYYEDYDDIETAIAREKQIKHWNRAWKIRLIRTMNPEWKDLSEGWAYSDMEVRVPMEQKEREDGSSPSRG